nr:DUF2142 domain-containing protein [uncultured Blautia sp.]
MNKKIQAIKGNKTSTAFAVYFFVILIIFIVQLATCRSDGYETYAFGVQADQEYEILDDHYINTEFVIKQDNAGGILFNGYKARGLEFKNEKLVVKFFNVNSGELIQSSELLFKDQIDEKNIYVPFEAEIAKGTRVRMQLRSVGFKNQGPYLGVSETNDSAEYSWIDGEVTNSYLCASLCYNVKNSNWLKPMIYFIAEFLAGLFLIFIQKKTNIPLSVGKMDVKNTVYKCSLKKLIVSLVIIWGVLFVFFDYIYMKTMEGAVRGKDAEVVCEETGETAQKINLNEGDEVSQIFYSNQDNLSAVAVHIEDASSVKADLTVSIYDNASGQLVSSIKAKTEKLDKLTKHVTSESRRLVWDIRKKYYVLELPDVIKDSANNYYKIVIKVDKVQEGNLTLIGGQGEDYPYELNSTPVTGNICMVSLYSNQMMFAKMFKYMVMILTVLVTFLFIAASLGKLSTGKTFVIAAIVLSFVYSFLIPPYCVPDERAHIDATYIISNEILGVDNNAGPNRIYKRVCDIDTSKENTMDVTEELYRETFENVFEKAEDTSLVATYADNPVGNVTFFNYLPAAVGFSIARLLRFNTTTMIMFGRWLNALTATLLMWIGIRKIPFGKATLAVLGLFPIMLQQVASCSYDGILLGAVYVYLAYGFSMLYAKDKSILDFGIMLLAGGFSAAACKGGVYIPLLGLILLVCWEIGRNVKEKIGWTFGAAIPMGLVFIGQFSQRIWRMFTRSNGSAYRDGLELYSLSDFIHAPNKLIRLYQNTIATQGDTQVQQIIGGKLGRLNVLIPWYILIAFLLLVIACCMKKKEERIYIKKGQRAFVFLISLVSIGLIMLSMLLAWTQNNCNYIAGLQGRYFLPVVGLLLLTLRNDKLVILKKNESYMVQIAAFLNVFVVGFALLSVLS